MKPRAPLAVGLVLPFAATACGPVLSTMTPARTLRAREVQASVGGSASIPVGQLLTLLDSANGAAERVRGGATLTDEQTSQLASDAVGFVLSPPSVTPELMARVGLGRRIDVGLRSTAGTWRLDGRFQFLDRETAPFDASVGLGLSYGSTPLRLGNDVIDLGDYTQFALDIPVHIGWSWRFGHLWLGPKFQYTAASVGVGLSLNDMNGDGARDQRLFEAATKNFHYGMQVGGAIGYRWVFFTLELTVAGLSASGTLSIPTAPPRSLTYGGLVLSPAFGLMLVL